MTASTAAAETSPPPADEYPARWQVDALLSDGGTVHVRPIRPADVPALRAFHARLSPGTVYLRFFSAKAELGETEATRFATVDYRDRMAFVAELDEGIVGVGRYDHLPGTTEAEVAFVVADAHQGRGVGSLLLEYLAGVARENGITRFCADTLVQNRRMLEVFHTAGFEDSTALVQGVVQVALDIEPTGAALAAADRREWTAGMRSIERILRPRSVAVIGAGRDASSIGHQVVRNLLGAGFAGPVHPINPHAEEIAGRRAYPSLDDVPGDIDLAVICVPAAAALEAVDACARKGVHGLVVISSGFAEIGAEGAVLQRHLVDRAHRGGMRLVGPNCIGVVNMAPDIRLDATFAGRIPTAGGIGFASQSGALGIALLERAAASGLGISSFVSMGNKADVSANDLLRYWHQDAATRVILLYLESFGNPRVFARVAPVVARRIPIVAVKSGRTVAGLRAAASHTAAMASPDDAVDALFHQCGVIRVDTLEELLDCGMVLADQPQPRGARIAVVGNAGGAGILAADAAVAAGLEVPELAPRVQARLRAIAGPNAGVANPVDMGSAANAEMYHEVLTAVVASGAVDAAVVILAPIPHAPAENVAAAVAGVPAGPLPVVFVHLGTDSIPAALRGDGHAIPCFAFPERAVRTLGRIAANARWRARPVGTVPALPDFDAGRAQTVAERVLASRPGGGWLDPLDAQEILRAAGIPVVEAATAHSATGAASAARRLGFPVVLKAVGATIVHKSEVGGVRLGLATASEVRRAFLEMRERIGPAMSGALVQPMVSSGVEMIVGVVADPVFGPLVMFGSGGTATEVLGDRAFRILPLTDVDAAELVQSIKGAPLLRGHRGAPLCDVAALEQILLRVARLAEEVPQLAQMDLNPVIATPHGATVVDQRIQLLPWTEHPEQAVRRLR